MCCVHPVDRGTRICRNVRQATERCMPSVGSREKIKRHFCRLVLTLYLIFSDNKLRSFHRLLLMTQYTVKCLVSVIPPDSCYVGGGRCDTRHDNVNRGFFRRSCPIRTCSPTAELWDVPKITSDISASLN